MKKTIYIAGPIFTKSQRDYLENIDEICTNIGIGTYLPHRDGGIKNKNNSNKIFQKDIENLNKSNLVVVCLTMPEIDAGTAFEIGFAYSKDIKIIGVLDDIRYFNKEQLNLMIEKSVKIVKNLEDLKKELIKYVN